VASERRRQGDGERPFSGRAKKMTRALGVRNDVRDLSRSDPSCRKNTLV